MAHTVSIIAVVWQPLRLANLVLDAVLWITISHEMSSSLLNHFHCIAVLLRLFRSKLKHNAAFVQIPIGLENDCKGIVDVIRRKALYFEGSHGQDVIEKPIPKDLESITEEKRIELIGNNVLCSG